MEVKTTYGNRQLSNGMTRVRCDIVADIPPEDMPYIGAEVDGLADTLEIDTGSTLHVLKPESFWIMGQDLAWYEMPARVAEDGDEETVDDVRVREAHDPRMPWLPLEHQTDDNVVYISFAVTRDRATKKQLIYGDSKYNVMPTVESGYIENGRYVSLGKIETRKIVVEDRIDDYPTADFDGNERIIVVVRLTWPKNAYSASVGGGDKYDDESYDLSGSIPTVGKFSFNYASTNASGTTGYLGVNTISLRDAKSFVDISGKHLEALVAASITGPYPLIASAHVTGISDCRSLQEIPEYIVKKIANDIASGSTNMESMFYGCASLQSVPEMDTSNVTNMESMFYGCASLQSVPEMDTSNVTNMESMFYGCASLQSIDVDISAVTTRLSYYFYMRPNTHYYPFFSGRSLRHARIKSLSGTTDAAKIPGNRTDIPIVDSKLDEYDLKGLLAELPVTANALVINITGNPGTASLTAETPEVVQARANGWTVIGVPEPETPPEEAVG